MINSDTLTAPAGKAWYRIENGILHVDPVAFAGDAKSVHDTDATADASARDKIAAIYHHNLATNTDIQLHLPFLNALASMVDHVTEMGTGTAQSTSAFLHARAKKHVAYDIRRREQIAPLETLAREAGLDFTFHEKSVLEVDIEPTDLLFIDTWHVGEQIQAELERHAHKAQRFLVMHDTESYGAFGDTVGHPGIWPPIAAYMRTHPEWRLLDHFPYCNGLTVFERIPNAGVTRATVRPQVIDCFTFHNELELLEIRLNELADVVDLFVLAESRYTFSGKEKPLYFKENAARFSKFPILHVEVPFHEGIAWDREFFTRNYMCANGIPGGDPDDVIILSDVDEIPSAAGVRNAFEMLRNGGERLIAWDQYFAYYYVNTYDGANVWHGAVAAKRRDFGGGQAMRALRGQGTLLKDGWHFSYLGGSQKIRQKIESFCDVEYNDEKYKSVEHLDECLEKGEDLFFRGNTYHYRPLDDSFPRYLIDNKERFAHLIRTIEKTEVDGPAPARTATNAPQTGLKINLGSQETRFDGFLNVDILPGPQVDMIGSAVSIPVADKSVSVLYHCAVFEHVFVGQHGLALAEASRVLADDGVHIALGLPNFRTIAELYLMGVRGIVGQRFDLFNVYRYTHGHPEMWPTDWTKADPIQPPPNWVAQLHKSLFDADYLHDLLATAPHVVFKYCYKGEPYPLSLGFIVSHTGLDIDRILRTRCPWASESIIEMSSLEVVEPSRLPEDQLIGVR